MLGGAAQPRWVHSMGNNGVIMSKKSHLFYLSIGVSLLTGCASQLLSNERIASETAGIIGVSPQEVTIENRRTEMTNTYYIAKTNDGNELSCVINGGNIVTFGLVNAPRCAKKGEPINTSLFHH
jgi:hypothetical protein